MRKLSFYIAVLLTAISLTACGQREQAVETARTPAEIAETVIASQSGLPALIQLTPGDEEFDSYLSDYYLLDREQISDGVICYADGAESSEIAVLVLGEESYAETVEEALAVYMENRAGVFEGYAPQQAALAKGGAIVTNGKYAALLMCPDTPAAKTAFLSCFGESGQMPETESAPIAPETVDSSESNDAQEQDSISPETEKPVKAADPTSDTPPAPDSAQTIKPAEMEHVTPPAETDNSYHSAAILRAWTSGDPSSLSERNLDILNAAKDVIDQKINGSMSDYEKELAIHDWITGWSSFNMNAFSRAPGSGDERDTDTPYGVLVNKSGNCWGYSSTFQLFMDMLDIECITVYGTPSSSGVEHAWNMVKLDDEWYCVDTAWDDPIGGVPGHTYFNRTSEEFRSSGIHRWDESSVPEATGTTYRYGA